MVIYLFYQLNNYIIYGHNDNNYPFFHNLFLALLMMPQLKPHHKFPVLFDFVGDHHKKAAEFVNFYWQLRLQFLLILQFCEKLMSLNQNH